MKLRIQGNSLRFRVSRSELARFVETGYLEETIWFGHDAGLTYALARDPSAKSVGVLPSSRGVTVLLPAAEARAWAATERVGIASAVEIAGRGRLSVLVEKDFACLDRDEIENADTFPNPLAAHIC